MKTPGVESTTLLTCEGSIEASAHEPAGHRSLHDLCVTAAQGNGCTQLSPAPGPGLLQGWREGEMHGRLQRRPPELEAVRFGLWCCVACGTPE